MAQPAIPSIAPPAAVFDTCSNPTSPTTSQSTPTGSRRFTYTNPALPNPQMSTAAKKNPKDFIFISTLGEGSFSTVYRAREVSSGFEFAIKVCNKQLIKKERKVPYIMREKEVMALLSSNEKVNPFFVRLYCTFQDETRLYFVMTLAPRGEMLDFMRKLGSFDDEATRFYSAEVICALTYLHSLGVIHRDMKPENVLLSDKMHILISDFGSAKIVGKDEDWSNRPTPLLPHPPPQAKKRSSFVGTAQYVSPEVLNGKHVTHSCDYWAVGCMIYQMLSGLPPFRAPNEYLMFQKIIKVEYSFPQGFPEVPKDFVQKLLVTNPDERLGGGNELELRDHPFLAGVNWDNLAQQEPPQLLPYLPASGDQPAFHSSIEPDLLQPGLDDAQVTRLLGMQLADFDAKDSRPNMGSSHLCDILLRKDERKDKLIDQRKSHHYHRFVDDNLILRSGLMDKKKGLFARRRMFLLTEGPHLYYVDPSNMELKGQIPWSPQLRPEAKNFKTLFVHTPNRTYYLFDPDNHAIDWCDAITQVRDYYFSRKDDNDK